MDAGRVQMLLIVGEANPVYSAPADLKFGEALQKVAWRAHSGLFHDETAELCQWHVPSTHYLEMWSDARSVDGTVSIVQPLLQPMYGGKSPHEVIATLSDRAERNGYDVVREDWTATIAPADGRRGSRLPPPAGSRRRPAGARAPPPAAVPVGTDRRRRSSRSSGASGCTTASSKARRPRRAPVALAAGWSASLRRRARRDRRRDPASSATARSTTAASPTTAGCRSCPSR